MKFTLCLLPILVIFSVSSSYAVETTVPDNDIPLLDSEQEVYLDEKQEEISEVLIGAALWVDSFFDDPRYISEENKTRAKVKLALGYSRNDSLEFQPSIDLRFKVPRLENKLNILVSAATDQDFDTDSNSTSDTELTEKDQINVSAQYFLLAAEKYNLSTTLGGSYNYLYAGLRYRYLHDFGPWQARFTDRLRYYTNDGWENKAELDLERHFSEQWFFRTILNAKWQEEEESIPYAAILRVYHVLNKENALLYEVGNYFETDPNHHLSDFQLKVRYRQRFYRDWLVLELTPMVSFPADHDREINPAFIAKLEFDFGYLSEQTEYDTIFKF